MRLLAWIVLAGAVAGPAAADAFELSDPANETMDPPPVEQSSGPGREPPDNALCTVDMATGACSCIDRARARRISMTQQECADHVRRSLDDYEP